MSRKLGRREGKKKVRQVGNERRVRESEEDGKTGGKESERSV